LVFWYPCGALGAPLGRLALWVFLSLSWSSVRSLCLVCSLSASLCGVLLWFLSLLLLVVVCCLFSVTLLSGVFLGLSSSWLVFLSSRLFLLSPRTSGLLVLLLGLGASSSLGFACSFGGVVRSALGVLPCVVSFSPFACALCSGRLRSFLECCYVYL